MHRLLGLLLLLWAGSVAVAAHADTVSITVTGEITSVNQTANYDPVDLSSFPLGTPYTWTATYDPSIASTPYPFLTNVGDSLSVLSMSLTIGSYSWTGQDLRMAIWCCTSNPSEYYNSIDFYADAASGSTLVGQGTTFAPAFLSYYFQIPQNILPSTATPTAAELASVPPYEFDLRLNATTNPSDSIDVYGGGDSQMVTISTVPLPATLGLLLTGIAELGLLTECRRRRVSRADLG